MRLRGAEPPLLLMQPTLIAPKVSCQGLISNNLETKTDLPLHEWHFKRGPRVVEAFENALGVTAGTS